LNPKELRLIGSDGKQLGIFSFEEAKKISEEKNEDLILVSANAVPPVVRLGNYKEWYYKKRKKEKEIKKKPKETKEIRIGFNEALHDLQRKANQIDEFLKEGHQVQIKMILKSRERLFLDLAEKKIEEFLGLLQEKYKVASPLKKFSNFLVIIISRQK